ncbi:monooxygenase [Mobilicoccus pelagius]|uniref:Monooxygenase n=1 Tax=Mobilicoccus pelagius NBRC 104925 TaxID=1089455 RepID=H5UTY4_9MICO|nr:monooxygenase [Mobilicoccus pelagius]GAB49192.1 hypothetical protein MOPEL_098_00590 [Mobilicoccus pelagius NBRC 104925]
MLQQSRPWGEDMSEAFAELAEHIAGEPGLRWKVWTEHRTEGIAGGVYLFDSEEQASSYLDKHTARLSGFGITGIRGLVLDVNEPLTRTTRGAARRVDAARGMTITGQQKLLPPDRPQVSATSTFFQTCARIPTWSLPPRGR